jgi:hypothetical protein
VPGEAAVVVNLNSRVFKGNTYKFFALLTSLIYLISSQPINALTVAEDRADVLYHAFDGGGVRVQGPSVLVRKGYKQKVSGYVNYYQDFVSSASIDVMSSGSKYSEERTEYAVGGEYLAKRALLSLNYTHSNESDYDAKTMGFGISQDFFGDMTTLAMGYSHGQDKVYTNNHSDGTTSFKGDAQHQRFSLGLSQILTKSWITSLSVETVVDDGFLRNPYRQISYLNVDDNNDFVRIGLAENYPTTRNSDALALRTIYYLPYHASIKLEARHFSDSWGIQASNYEARYTHGIRSLLIEVKARTYRQTQADFYYDLFPEVPSNNPDVYFARDKELSTYTTNSFGFGITYPLPFRLPFAKKHNLNLYWDYMEFDYDNFRNLLLSRSQNGQPAAYAVGNEPTYAFEANVIRFYYSVVY